MMRWTALTLLAVPLAAQAQTAPPSPAAPSGSAQGDVSVTIYNNNVALVQDARVLTLPGGKTKQEFADVSASIRPETVTLSIGEAGIVEQNFDFDLLTPQKLMNKAVGQTVTVVRTNPATGVETRETARILANNNGTVVQIGDRIEVLPADARVIFPTLPPNLRARPTLSIMLDGPAGRRPATLSYLTSGLGWKADYVAMFDERAGKMDVQGWITLTNNSGTTYTSAKTLLVAGQPGGQGNARPNTIYRPRPGAIPGNMPGTETADREQLGDFYLYPIAERTTIANAQQKQVSFLDAIGAPAAKTYFFRNPWLGSSDQATSADTVINFSSSRTGGLGDALPAGTVRIYMRDARGQAQFIGEANIGHTPMGSQLALKTGEAFDVKVQPIVEKREKIGSDRWRTTMRYKFTNARSAPVTVDFAQGGLDIWWTDSRIESESLPSTRGNADEALWKVPVPANGEAELTVVFTTRY